MPDSYNNSMEDPQEPSQPVSPALPVQPPGDVQAPPDSVPVAALQDNQDKLSIINGHQNFLVPATSDPDQQTVTLHASNGTFQKEEHNGEVKSDVTDDTPNTTQTWHIFSHEISVKTGFPGRESWTQEDRHNGEVDLDSLELEGVTLILPAEEGRAVAQPATDDLEMRPQEQGHNGEVHLDSLELEEKTLKLPAVKGQAVAQPAPCDLTVVIPTRNERDNIMPLLHELQGALDGMRVEIIFVDDSDDDTPLIIEDASVAMGKSMFQVHIEHRQPGSARAGGLATAVVHGMNRAHSEYVAVIDADLQHPPELLCMLYDQAVAKNADLVVASRYNKGGSYRGLAGVGRRCISAGLKWTAKLLFPGQLLRISDPLSGFFLLRRSLLVDVSLRPIGYKILLEILIRCKWRQVLEVPYHFQARAHGQSKATMQQGILALRHMLRLWREVPAAGRVWKISLLLLVNVLIALALSIVYKSFPWVWANLYIVVFGVMACLDFVLFNRFIFPSPHVTSSAAPSEPSLMFVEERETVKVSSRAPAVHDGQSEEQTLSTLARENLAAQRASPSRLSRPRGKRRRILLATNIILPIALIFALVRLTSILSATDDQLRLSLGGQGTALVDLRQSSTISPYLFGANVFPKIASDSVDQRYSGFMSYSPPITSGLRNARINLLRFPGGSWGEEHLLSYDQLNDFSVLLSEVGADGMIQVPLTGPTGTSTHVLASLTDRVNQAGRWVDYMNNPHSSLRTGKYANAPFYPIKFWTVGNEPDLLLNPDTGNLFTVAEYVNDFIQFSLMMHQNNPTIQVFGPDISQFYGVGVGPTDPKGLLWMESFLKGVGTYEKTHPELKFHLLDGVSFHFYPSAEVSKSPNLLLSSTYVWNYLLPQLRELIRQDLGRDAPIAVTEINSNALNQAPSRGLAALWWADTLGTLMDQEVEYVAFFSAEGVDTPYPMFTSDGLRQTPMFRVMQVFSHLQHNLVPLQVQQNPVGVYATQDDTHQTLSLLFVNTSDTTQLAQIGAQNRFFGFSSWPGVDLTLFGFSITLVTLHRGGGAEAYSYTVPNVNDPDVVPLLYTVCGNNLDPLAHVKPC